MERSDGNGTVTVAENLTDTVEVQQIVLTTPETDPSHRVRWSAETVDNEFMGKQKSKCCCIYKKPKKWNEDSDSDSDSDCETGHCRGHVEKRHGKDEGEGGEPGPSCST
ncbi:Protein phosphatase 1 regulatory subunit 11 [Toxocara canis]|uniref:E3 ubiquitin-protein ligase PPP1R11 n=2 Tax=Toxocara canis TaxID=6265 RepID=A0A0B2W184_TOXCA|nr:Protein phosphatase 1 regulatory subunit 11 [Toxocara canis]VDM40487.1 unnamed protein product [Toxocara canis]